MIKPTGLPSFEVTNDNLFWKAIKHTCNGVLKKNQKFKNEISVGYQDKI